MAITKIDVQGQCEARSGVVGDTLYVSDTNGTITRLAPNTAATAKMLTQTGTGAAGQAPVWSDISSFSGYSGYSGKSGWSGFSGTNGSTGTSGWSGYSGVSGWSGISGYSGRSGWSGFSGSNGSTGTSGWSGFSGTNGSTGTSGWSGFSGISGWSGFSGYSGRSGWSGISGTNGSTGGTGTSGWSGYSGTAGGTGTSGWSGYSGKSGYSGALTTGSNAQVNSLGVNTAPSGTAGEIRATGQITAYYSDLRLKENIRPITDALKKIDSIEGITYNANALAASMGYDPTIEEIGIIAQDLQLVLPQAVVPAPIDENYLTIRYEKVVCLLLNAVKELAEKVKTLEGKV